MKHSLIIKKDGVFVKIKDSVAEKLLVFYCIVLFIIFLPFFLLYLLFKLLWTPFDYIKYKKSRYQKDFPHKYTWLRDRHVDNEAYTAIKENNLPIEYMRLFEDYDIPGHFVYKDVLLWFYSSVFYDKNKKQWLWWPGNKNTDEEAKECVDNEENLESENTDDCLSVEELKTFILDEFNSKISAHQCSRVVFFYERKKIVREYGKEAFEIMCQLDDFIIYEKGELAKSIKKFIESQVS